MAEGQRNDAVVVSTVLAEARAAVGHVDEVLADKGCDSDKVRGVILGELDLLPVIPNKVNRRVPSPWDESMRETYTDRNREDRGFGKAK